LEVSVVGLGGNTLGTSFFGSRVDAGRAREIIDAAADVGINFIDTADVYGDSEELLGKALGGRRDDFVLATKFGAQGGASAAAVTAAIEKSLRRLGTDHIDLYQLHRPDPDVTIEETLTALDGLVRAGKVIEIGCSNYSAEQLREAAEVSSANGLARFVSVQNELSVLRSRDAGAMLPTCVELDVAYIPFSPLASGLLTGKYRRGEAPSGETRLGNLPAELAERSLSDATFDRLDRLGSFAAEHHHSLIELAFGWLLAQPCVASVIAGATRAEQVRANADAAGWMLTSDEATEAADVAT
jgi:aryl-alcohol dehydrogenase-like predicted oxidoreductase